MRNVLSTYWMNSVNMIKECFHFVFKSFKAVLWRHFCLFLVHLSVYCRCVLCLQICRCLCMEFGCVVCSAYVVILRMIWCFIYLHVLSQFAVSNSAPSAAVVNCVLLHVGKSVQNSINLFRPEIRSTMTKKIPERGFYSPRHQSHIQLCEVFGHLNELFRTQSSKRSTNPNPSDTDVFCDAMLKS